MEKLSEYIEELACVNKFQETDEYIEKLVEQEKVKCDWE